jgi:thiol-disulfide isomerase/thioredoxin
VITVFPDSPAITAGLEVGDIIVGPPKNPFVEPNQVREWTMRSEIGTPERLRVLREARPLEVTLRPGPYPVEMPKLPGPPQVGSTAPPLKVELVQGGKRIVENKPRLLYFWATWCVICKSALPEVLAFSQARNVDVVAITDEEPGTVAGFLREFHDPFPSIVATDPLRATFQSYGVSGFPTFVLVDADGTVKFYQTGYKRRSGLGIEGWHWDQPPKDLSRAGP